MLQCFEAGTIKDLSEVGKRISVKQGVDWNSVASIVFGLAQEHIFENPGVFPDALRVLISLQSWFNDALVKLPFFAMGADDVFACVLSKYAVWDLDLVARLCVGVFLLENLCYVGRLRHQNVPLSTEEQLHCAISRQRLLEVFPI